LKLKAFELILNRFLSLCEDLSPGRTDRLKRGGSSEVRASRNPGEVEQADGVPRSTPGRILQLKAEGFFGEQRGIGEIREELQTHGWIYPVTALSGALMKLVGARELRRERVNEGNKKVYKYFNP
jgi:hypothetical protein